jgi:hypothetical protein
MGWSPAALQFCAAAVECDLVDHRSGAGRGALSAAAKEAHRKGGEGEEGGRGKEEGGAKAATPSFYFKFILASDRAALLRYDDFSYMAQSAALPPSWPPRGPEVEAGLFFVEVLEVREAEGAITGVTLLLHGRRGGLVPAVCETVFLSPRWVDPNAVKAEQRLLAEMDKARAGGRSHLLQLLEEPLRFAVEGPVPAPATLEDALRAAPHLAHGDGPLGLDASQEACFESVVRSRLSLVWGPPGTGKTTFLSRAILRLVGALRSPAAPPFRVLCTAVAKSAVAELMGKLQRCLDDCSDKALAPFGREWGKSVVLLNHHAAPPSPRVSGSTVAVVEGATVWAAFRECTKTEKKGGAWERYNLVVIDEASQKLLCDAAVAVGMLARGGRLVVVGDAAQLGPIKGAGKNEYPTQREAGALPGPLPAHLAHLSVLECLQAVVREGGGGGGGAPPPPLEGPLLTCYRMNQPLVALSQRLYSAGFTSACPQRRLARRAPPPPGAAPSATSLLLDERAALLALRLPDLGDDATEGALRALEACAVAALVAALLREGGVVEGGGGAAAPAAAPLRCRDIFVVTPHRLQRAAVTAALRGEPHLAALPDLQELLENVDTTEKMQGREAEVVVACWGLSRATLLSELDFVLDLRRINVAVTRARVAAVLVLSDAVADPPLEAAGDARSAAMEYFASFVKSAREWREGAP